jgi:tape measure domain-containing protein
MSDTSFSVGLKDDVSGPANSAAKALAKMASEAEKLSKIKNSFEGITGSKVSDAEFKKIQAFSDKMAKIESANLKAASKASAKLESDKMKVEAKTASESKKAEAAKIRDAEKAAKISENLAIKVESAKLKEATKVALASAKAKAKGEQQATKASPMTKISEVISGKIGTSFSGSLLGAGLQNILSGDIGAKLAQFGLGFEQIGTLAAGAAGLIGSVFVGACLAGVAAVGALVVGLGAAAFKFAEFGIRSGVFQENSLVELKTILKSSTEAEKVYSDAVKFAARTPFSTQETVDLFKSLIGAGFKPGDLERAATAIGDAVSTTGGGKETMGRVTQALAKIRATGKLQLDELNILFENRVVNQEDLYKTIADSMGVKDPTKVADLISKGKIKGDVAIEAILKTMETTRGGGMEAKSKTLEGAWSTLSSLPFELFDQAKAKKGGGMAGFYDSIKEIVNTINSAFAGNSTGAQMLVGWINGIATALTVVSKLMLSLVQGFLKGFGVDKLASSTKGLTELNPKSIEELGKNIAVVGAAAGTAASGMINLNAQIISAIGYASQFDAVLTVVKVTAIAIAVVVGVIAAAIGIVLLGVFITIAAPILVTIALVGAVIAVFWAFLAAIDSVVNAVSGLDLSSIGGNIVQGLINGMQSKMGELSAIASTMAATVKDGVAGATGLNLGSPSKVMKSFGGYTAEGLSQGISAGTAEVAKTSVNMAAAVTQGASTGSAGASGGGKGGIQIGTLNVTASGGGAEALKNSILEALEMISIEMGSLNPGAI